MECCNEATASISAISRASSYNSSAASSAGFARGGGALRPATTAIDGVSDAEAARDRLNEVFDNSDEGAGLDSSFAHESYDLCRIMRGLLCSDICVPTPGSYRCKCHEGSSLQEDRRTCKPNGARAPTSRSTADDAETRRKRRSAASSSSSLSDTMAAATEDNELSPLCPSGYRFSSSACDDIDECREEPVALCPDGSSCLNTNGSYECVVAEATTATSSLDSTGTDSGGVDDQQGVCELGYRWNSTTAKCVDVDECFENIHKCLAELENCRNLEGAYECEIKCDEGFVFNGNYGACLDINECNELLNICQNPDTICVNTLGSYECRSITEYQQFNGINGTIYEIAGEEDSEIGDEIDECQLHPQPCLPGEHCRDTLAGYDCVPAGCARGFVLVNETCQDLDECELGLHSCTILERCQNTNGSFTCEQPRPTRRPSTSEPPKMDCRKGYRADYQLDKCVDVNECVEGPGCREHETCRNLLGSYDCFPLCGLGWYFDYKTKTCQDVDECLLGQHTCRQRTQSCRNTQGSYVCEDLAACGSGYRRSQNGSCADVDECHEGLHTCSRASHRYCVNREGGYECITRLPACSPGFEYSLLTRDCVDVDECRGGARTPCRLDLGERCVNLPGSYRCERHTPLGLPPQKRPACPAGHAYEPLLRRCSPVVKAAES